MKRAINWKLFWILLGGSIFGVIAIIPYLLTLEAPLLKELPLPLHIILLIQILQNVILFAFFIFVGLYLMERVNLRIPILESWLEGREVKTHLKSVLGISIAFGALAAIIAIGIDSVLSAFIQPVIIIKVSHPPIWQGLLASFYSGINEEVAMRLFLMTLLVWIFYKIKKTKEGEPTNLDVWLGILLSAIIFGIAHLPITAKFIKITILVVIRAIILNGIPGIFYGWLYWKKGLESAMISHFISAILLRVIFPFFIA